MGRAAGASDGGALARGRNGSAREAGIGDCLADCGLALGKTPAEIAQNVSLPELFLILKRNDRKEVERLRIQMDVAFLAAAAPWSAKAGRMLERWRAEVVDTYAK